MWVLYCKSYSHFFSKKFQHTCVSFDVNFNESLTNDIISFEQLGPAVFSTTKTTDSINFRLEHFIHKIVLQTRFDEVELNNVQKLVVSDGQLTTNIDTIQPIRVRKQNIMLNYLNLAAGWQKDPLGIYQWRSSKPVRTATHQFKAISPISIRYLYCVGEQRRSWPDCADAQSGQYLCCLHMFYIWSLFSAAGQIKTITITQYRWKLAYDILKWDICYLNKKEEKYHVITYLPTCLRDYSAFHFCRFFSDSNKYAQDFFFVFCEKNKTKKKKKTKTKKNDKNCACSKSAVTCNWEKVKRTIVKEKVPYHWIFLRFGDGPAVFLDHSYTPSKLKIVNQVHAYIYIFAYPLHDTIFT